MKKYLFLFIIFLSYNITISQNLDSLFIVAKTIKNDSIKIRMYNKIAFSYIFNDTDKAIKIIKEGKQLAKEKAFYFGLTELTNTHGIYMDVTSKSDSANYYFTKALELSKQFKFNDIEVMCTNNLGMFNWNRGNFQEALHYFFEALRMNDDFGTEKQRSIYLNNIGLIYQEMSLMDKALEYHQKAYDIRLKYNDKKGQATSLNNIGICYKELSRLKEAEETYIKGLDVAKASDNLRDYYKILENLANTYQINQEYQKAIKTYLRALDKPENFKSEEKSNILLYGSIAAVYNKINNPEKALFYANKGLEILKANQYIESYSGDLYLQVAESNYMTNNYKVARKFIEKFVTVKDSVFSEQNAKAVADLEIKYDTEKKEKQILIQRAELAEKSLTIQKRNYQLYGLIALALILSLLGYLFYNQQKLKNIQLQKENELKDALVKIETQNRLQEQRLRISRDLHDNIGAQLTFIISSIDNLKYGFDIKDDKLTNKLDSISNFTSSTIYELRDTIWAMNKNKITFEDIKTRITNYIDKAKIASSNIDFEFNTSNEIDNNKAFTSLEGINIHRVIQEAINNSLKHAEASLVSVDIKKKGSAIEINISDTGKGFDVATSQQGNGLMNMKKRIHEIGGDFKIVTSKNQGTQIVITI